MKQNIQEYEIKSTSTATISNLVENGVYYSFTCTGAGTFILMSWGYYDLIRRGYSVTSATENILKIPEPMLVMDVSDYETIADFIYDYMQQRYKYIFKTFGRVDAVGDEVTAITSNSARQVMGTIVKNEINLIGMVSKVTLIGVLEDV